MLLKTLLSSILPPLLFAEVRSINISIAVKAIQWLIMSLGQLCDIVIETAATISIPRKTVTTAMSLGIAVVALLSQHPSLKHFLQFVLGEKHINHYLANIAAIYGAKPDEDRFKVYRTRNGLDEFAYIFGWTVNHLDSIILATHKTMIQKWALAPPLVSFPELKVPCKGKYTQIPGLIKLLSNMRNQSQIQLIYSLSSLDASFSTRGIWRQQTLFHDFMIVWSIWRCGLCHFNYNKGQQA